MKEAEKYLVIPIKYLEHLSDNHVKILTEINNVITSIRIASEKDPYPKYIVCKELEPYAGKVWDLILEEIYNNEKLLGLNNEK